MFILLRTAPTKFILAQRIFVDRILYTSMPYPGNYGFIPQTLAEDGDPIDVLVVGQQRIVPGAVMNCRPVGVLLMKDEAGPRRKILAVPSDKVSSMYRDVEDFRNLIQLLQISHFFEHYKELENSKWAKVERWSNAELARKLIQKAIQRLKQSRCSRMKACSSPRSLLGRTLLRFQDAPNASQHMSVEAWSMKRCPIFFGVVMVGYSPSQMGEIMFFRVPSNG